METILATTLSAASIFLFFCVLSVDPEGKARVYVGNPLWGYKTFVEDDDPRFQIFGFGALIWTGALLALEHFNSEYCSMKPSSLLSQEALFATLTIWVTGKIFIGPVLQAKKSLRLVGHNKFTQPVLFKLYDAIRVYPTNFITSLS